jgi:hypothetical protein
MKKTGSNTNIQSSASASSSFGNFIYNVGGRRFEISPSLLQQYPECTLPRPSTTLGPSREFFLDHNPDAFQVILDYMRYREKVLVPRNVCREVVILQMKQFGLQVGVVEEKGDGDGLPSYDELVDKSGKGKQDVVRVRIEELVQSVLLPLVKDYARQGYVKLYIYMLDQPLQTSSVASTLEEDAPVEWLVLGTHQQSQNSEPFSSSTPMVESTIEAMDDISQSQKTRIINAIRKSRSAEDGARSISSLPNTAYLLQTGVLSVLETVLKSKSSVRSVQGERRDLTIRKENEFGLMESTDSITIKLSIQIA